MSEKLLNCPFCGSEAFVETFTTAAEKFPRYRVKCSNCFAETNWDFFTVGDVVAAWNQRVELTAKVIEQDNMPSGKCEHCGQRVRDVEMNYCPNCGYKLEWE